jgi:hypothetical protein
MKLKNIFGPLWSLLVLSSGIAATVASAQIAFTDVTASAGVTHTSESYGASFGDLNGDGYLDIYVSNHRTPDSLWLNRGDGTFLDVASQTFDFKNRLNADTHGGTWADYNNSGHQDLMVSTGRGNLLELLVNENQRLVDLTLPLGLGEPGIGGRLPVWLDYDGDHLLDVVIANYDGPDKLFHQLPNGTFIDNTASAKFSCVQDMYSHLFDATGLGHLDFLCAGANDVPQKVYDPTIFPWKKLFDSTAPNSLFPLVPLVADSVVADFNNDGRMDIFLLSNVQLRPSSVDQGGPNNFESLLAGGSKGFEFVSTGLLTFIVNWNKADEGVGTDVKNIQIGAGARNPTAATFTLDPNDPTVAGSPPPPTSTTQLPLMQISYTPATHRWVTKIVTKLSPTGAGVFSEGYFQVSSTAPITLLKGDGLWPSDKAARPTLLINTPTGYVDATVAAGLDTPVQCSSVTAGDFDNDMYIDLYLACRTGAKNIANILYHNNGNGTFTAVPNAGGAAGPVGLAITDGAGTADSVISGDYDVDGFLDLYVTNGFNLQPAYIGGPNKLFHNNGNANHWIELDLVGVNSDRDATGARVSATALGVTQYRVQDGRYHRWSQDAKRMHFGLASAAAANITVKWPSGAVQTFPNVAANTLYTITEGAANPVPVALGIAPAYPCGLPNLNGAVDSGVFVYRDCPSGAWMLRTAVAGASNVFTGTITSNQPYSGVMGIGTTSGDSVTTPNPNQIDFTFHTNGSNTAGVNFTPVDFSSSCLKITAPASLPVYFGPFRVPEGTSFSLETQGPC